MPLPYYGLFILCAGMLGASGVSAQPSFDCAKATTGNERAICDNPGLARLDLALAAAYAQAREVNSEADSKRIGREQAEWLGFRDTCEGEANCLETLMSARLEALQSEAGERVNTGLSGTYCARDGMDMVIIHDTSDAIEVRFSSLQTNGHNCAAARTRAERSNGRYSFTENGCTITITDTGDRLVLDSNLAMGCSYFCGARAQIRDLSFDKTDRAPEPKPGWLSAMETGDC
ncbi:MAG: lysozyme inhibitor LprI family protein [Aurantimonas coralicida]|uniref:lysozyme inhibitor LprI family protein n=1 Tax=Nisaea sp. TaxID=2024842 RepID=UPI003264C1E0